MKTKILFVLVGFVASVRICHWGAAAACPRSPARHRHDHRLGSTRQSGCRTGAAWSRVGKYVVQMTCEEDVDHLVAAMQWSSNSPVRERRISVCYAIFVFLWFSFLKKKKKKKKAWVLLLALPSCC